MKWSPNYAAQDEKISKSKCIVVLLIQEVRQK